MCFDLLQDVLYAFFLTRSFCFLSPRCYQAAHSLILQFYILCDQCLFAEGLVQHSPFPCPSEEKRTNVEEFWTRPQCRLPYYMGLNDKNKSVAKHSCQARNHKVVMGMRLKNLEKSDTRKNDRSFHMKRKRKIAHFMKNTLFFEKMRNWHPNQSHCDASGSAISSLKHSMCF